MLCMLESVTGIGSDGGSKMQAFCKAWAALRAAWVSTCSRVLGKFPIKWSGVPS